MYTDILQKGDLLVLLSRAMRTNPPMIHIQAMLRAVKIMLGVRNIRVNTARMIIYLFDCNDPVNRMIGLALLEARCTM